MILTKTKRCKTGALLGTPIFTIITSARSNRPDIKKNTANILNVMVYLLKNIRAVVSGNSTDSADILLITWYIRNTKSLSVGFWGNLVRGREVLVLQ